MNLRKAIELRKAKYTKRWKGKDGNWRYEYPRPKKDRKRNLLLEQIESGISKLDYERAYVFDKNNKILLRKTGEKSIVRFTQSEFEKIKGAKVFTHNHPSGQSFSAEDIKTLNYLRVGEIRAVGKEHVHIAKISGKFDEWNVFINKVVNRDIITKQNFNSSIREGKMTIEEANKNHWHEVWTKVAKETNGFEYERIKRREIK